MKILAIDDDEQIRRLFALALANAGWTVVLAADGEAGLRAARDERPDVVLLDLNLPDRSGGELLAELRAWSSVPVVVVSVRDAADDIAGLLEAGADDYIVKPFHTAVLIARIRAVHRRGAPDADADGRIRLGRLTIDPGLHAVAVDGDPVRLTPTEFSILAQLAKYPGKIVTRGRLLKEIWGPAGEAEEGSLRVHIASIRKKIEADPSAPSLLVTEPGVGYRLALEPRDRS
jgi:two-component system KDP operon response regulator KdpE